MGATGQTGRHLVADLLRNGATVRALARDVSTAQRMLGPEIVEGDLVRPSTLNPALKGAERLYLLAPPNPRLSAMEASHIGAARRAGARHIVKHSAIDASPNARSDVARMHFAGEQLLVASGLGYTIPRASMFMQNFLILMPAIVSQGVLCTDGHRPVRLHRLLRLRSPRRYSRGHHDGHAYLATGEQALSVDDAPGTCRTRLAARSDIATSLWRPCRDLRQGRL